jgi:hypothetical protein
VARTRLPDLREAGSFAILPRVAGKVNGRARAERRQTTVGARCARPPAPEACNSGSGTAAAGACNAPPLRP